MNRFNLTLLAIVLSPAAPHCFGAGPNYEQLRAVREISEMGGSVVIDESRPDKPVVSVNLVSEKVSDAGLECLEDLHELQSLDLSAPHKLVPLRGIGPQPLNVEWLPTGFTGAGLRHIKGLTNLKSLDLTGTTVDDAGLENIEGLTQLESLNLSLTPLTSAGMKHLKGLSSLRLELTRTKVDDSGLESLSDLAHLQSLNLWGTRVTGTGLIHLKNLAELRTLSITAYKLDHLKGLTHLRRLTIDSPGNALDDAELVNLKELADLEWLELRSGNITDARRGEPGAA